jgi:hypothetical protein
MFARGQSSTSTPIRRRLRATVGFLNSMPSVLAVIGTDAPAPAMLAA